MVPTQWCSGYGYWLLNPEVTCSNSGYAMVFPLKFEFFWISSGLAGRDDPTCPYNGTDSPYIGGDRTCEFSKLS
jgi:hypothetical protein